MLIILFKILSILGILLLVILGLLLLLVLTVLFVPITYRVRADKQDELHIAAGLNWCLGLVRARFCYPDPGNVTVKALWFKVFDSAAGSAKPPKAADEMGDDEAEAVSRAEKGGSSGCGDPDRAGKAGRQGTAGEKTAHRNNAGESSKRGPLEKLQYTFRDFCDKIKDIRENIAYYRSILLCDDTKGLLNHAFMRIGKILKSIRPGKLKADVRFGTGSPDTTGYAFALYGILCPYLGKSVLLVPDFEQAVLAGELCAAGHITVFRILWNGLMLVTDKRLRKLISKLRREE